MKLLILLSTLLFFFASTWSGFCQSSSIAALVKTKKDGWHYINERGEMLLKAQHENYQFSDNLLMRFKKNKWGYVDCNETWVIPPTFDAVKDFVNGYARVKSDGLWTMINKKGEAITDYPLDGVYDFSEGMARVKIDGLWGYMDTTGTLAVKPQYPRAEDFRNGKASVFKDEKWFLINKEGEVAIDPNNGSYTFLGQYSHGRIRVRTGKYGTKIRWGYLDSLGRQAISSIFISAEDFYDGLARVREKDKWGYIQPNGKYLIHPSFEDAEDFKDGYARVSQDGKWGIIDTKGRWICPPDIDILWEITNGYAGARKKGDWGIINLKGDWILGNDFKYVKSIGALNCSQ